jgi:hypothetical protein
VWVGVGGGEPTGVSSKVPASGGGCQQIRETLSVTKNLKKLTSTEMVSALPIPADEFLKWHGIFT